MITARRAVFVCFLLLAGAVVRAGEPAAPEPLRFLVMGDPQFRQIRPDPWDDAVYMGYEWQSPAWQSLPQLMERIDADYLFVCGDIFEYHDGDGTTAAKMWDVWDEYIAGFEDIGRLEWVPGGHEFWDSTAEQDKQLLMERYPDHIRYSFEVGGSVFILFDDVHNPTTFDDRGLEWLESTLADAEDADHVFFFGHVPPRHADEWWPGPKPSVERDGRHEFRSRMAALLEERGITAAFFGHEHRETHLGDTGGFPMFEAACRYPLLVEVQGDRVDYRWIAEPAAEDPLASTLPMDGPPLTEWEVTAVTGGQAGEQTFRVQADDGIVDLGGLEELKGAEQAVVTASYPVLAGWGGRCVRIRSSMPYSLSASGQLIDTHGPTGDRFRAYQVRIRRRDVNNVEVVFDLKGPERTFTVIPQSFPEEMKTVRAAAARAQQ